MMKIVGWQNHQLYVDHVYLEKLIVWIIQILLDILEVNLLLKLF